MDIDPVYDAEYFIAKDHCRRFLLTVGAEFHKSELRVALALLEYTSGVEFTMTKLLAAYPGVERLAKALSISTDQVRRWRQSLVERGVLYLDGDNRGGRKKTTRFVFNPAWFADETKVVAWGWEASEYPGMTKETMASPSSNPGKRAKKPMGLGVKTPGPKTPVEISKYRNKETTSRARAREGGEDFCIDQGEEKERRPRNGNPLVNAALDLIEGGSDE